MKTHSQKSNSKFCLGALGIALFLLAIYPQSAMAQQTNTFPQSGNAGIGTTTPNYPLDVLVNSQWAARFKKTDATNGGIIVDAAAGYNPNLAMSVNGAIKWYLNSATGNGDALQFWESTGTYPRFTLTQAGNVGIGTTSPAVLIDVKGNNVAYAGQLRLQASDYAQMTFYNSNAATVGPANAKASIYYSMPDNVFHVLNSNGTGGGSLILNEQGGNVGIGTSTPANKLHVAGSITVDGNINAKYQDLAEWVQSSQQLPAGTVVVLDHTKSNQVIASSQAYDTRVAGVISSQPGIALGEKGESKVLVATTGRVKVKVDATAGPIQVGDLLVTGDKPGLAIKSQPVSIGGVQLHRPGTLIGKALEPLATGQGEILVLLSLQ